jgi:hypothetical protein
VAYACATILAPSWSSAWFNRGLIAKFQRRWEDCRTFNLRAAELDPNEPPAWWNLGIAATALGDWETAREAWSRYGIDVPAGTGPIDMNLGTVPIRVAPLHRPEVVWCRRLDPARARIHSVPTPESGRGYGDTVLHDGEPRGKRMHAGRELSVFDELQLLSPGALSTFSVSVVAPAPSDMEALEASSIDDTLVIEDWSSNVKPICAHCSEGRPHEHEHADASEEAWPAEHVVGVAAESAEAIRAGIMRWVGEGGGRALESIERVFTRGLTEGPRPG